MSTDLKMLSKLGCVFSLIRFSISRPVDINFNVFQKNKIKQKGMTIQTCVATKNNVYGNKKFIFICFWFY